MQIHITIISIFVFANSQDKRAFACYTAWSSCSGNTFSYRFYSNGCPNYAMETASCIVNGIWGCWGDWTTCSRTCGTGNRIRTRSCNTPSIQCAGSSTDSENCNSQPCPQNGEWGSWILLTTCSLTCGGGVSARIRECNNPSPANGGSYCVGSRTMMVDCNSYPCPINGQWSSWSNWTNCQTGFMDGCQNRSRECINPSPAYGGKYCAEQSTEYRLCSGPNNEKTYCCSPEVVVGVAISCVILTLAFVAGVLIARKHHFLLGTGIKDIPTVRSNYNDVRQSGERFYESFVNHGEQCVMESSETQPKKLAETSELTTGVEESVASSSQNQAHKPTTAGKHSNCQDRLVEETNEIPKKKLAGESTGNEESNTDLSETQPKKLSENCEVSIAYENLQL